MISHPGYPGYPPDLEERPIGFLYQNAEGVMLRWTGDYWTHARLVQGWLWPELEVR